MRRRGFLAASISAAAGVQPLAAWALTDRVRRVGVMMVNSENDAEGARRIGSFRNELQNLGWTEGHNLQLEYRWAVGNAEHARAAAIELAIAVPNVIVANGTPAVAALQKATRTIPIVFVVVTDPVGAGFVQGLSRPGGNTTGFSTFEPEIGGKWMGLLKEMAPGLRETLK